MYKEQKYAAGFYESRRELSGRLANPLRGSRGEACPPISRQERCHRGKRFLNSPAFATALFLENKTPRKQHLKLTSFFSNAVPLI